MTRKTRMQVEHALGLLERARGSSDGTEGKSLPELVADYEAMLRQVVESLGKIAETSQQLERRHEVVRGNLKHIDTLLDQLSAHDSQIGMLALNTSVAAGSGADFVSVSDQIRTISLESKALTRDIRRTLEEVRGQSQETHAAVRIAVQQARDAATSASEESGKLKTGMLDNNRALEQTLRRSAPWAMNPDRHQQHHCGVAVPRHHPAEAAATEASHADGSDNVAAGHF